MRDSKYYDSDKIWSQGLALGQRLLAKAIIDFWPSNVGRFLDIGCGDGKIANIIASETGSKPEGVDLSETALENCKFDTHIANVCSLPFENESFESAVCTDVLEHLNKNEEAEAVNEIFRISQKFVFLAVPYQEILLESFATCSDCGCSYHINYHNRAYNIATAQSLVPEGWKIEQTILTGESWSDRTLDEIVAERVIQKIPAYWENAMCPLCSQKASKPHLEQSQFHLLEQAVSRRFHGKEIGNHSRSHTEILLVCVKKDISCSNSAKFVDFSEVFEQASIKALDYSLWHGAGSHFLVNYPTQSRLVCTKEENIIQIPFMDEEESLDVLVNLDDMALFRKNFVFEAAGKAANVKISSIEKGRFRIAANAPINARYGLIVRYKSSIGSVSIESNYPKKCYLIREPEESGYALKSLDSGQNILIQLRPGLVITNALWNSELQFDVDSSVSELNHFLDFNEEKSALLNTDTNSREQNHETENRLAIANDTIDKLNVELETTRIESQNLKVESDIHASEKVEKEGQLEQLRIKVQNLEAKTATYAQELNNSRALSDELRSELELVKVARQNVELESVSHAKGKEEKESELELKRIDIQNLEAMCNSVSKELVATRALLDERNAKTEQTKIALQNARLESASHAAAAQEREAELESRRIEFQNLEQRCLDYSEGLEASHALSDELNTELEKVNVALQNSKSESASHVAAVQEREVELESKRIEIQNLEARLIDLVKERDELLNTN